MKSDWCKLGLHKWKYNDTKTERHCIYCKKTEILDFDDELSGFQTGTYWQDKEPATHKIKKSLVIQILTVFAIMILALLAKSII